MCFVTDAYDQCIVVDWDVEGGAITLLSVLSQRVVRVTIGVTSGHITHEQPSGDERTLHSLGAQIRLSVHSGPVLVLTGTVVTII